MERTYIAIDLKSFYASVECMERGLDPLTTNLVVADESRTAKTICLAVSPSLKAYGISGRARLFEVIRRVGEVNGERQRLAPDGVLTGESCQAGELADDPSLALSYITAPPRMAYYMDYSTRIFRIYLKYVAMEDITAYSIDEVFMDVTGYLDTLGLTAQQLAAVIIRDVLSQTGITATAGIGPNLYLAKIAMDVWAKHIPADGDGVRIATLDEYSYRKNLWTHEPITDFWRVGKGTARKLAEHGILTMGDIARCSLGKPGEYYCEDLLYRLFGVNAELLIDHAWGYEPVQLKDIKAYRPDNKSIQSGQVLNTPYTAQNARLVIREMADLLALDLVDKGLLCDQLVLTVGYDIENLTDHERRKAYKGAITTDAYGRQVPKAAHGTINLEAYTSSSVKLMTAVCELYDRIVDPKLLVRRMAVSANHVRPENDLPRKETYEQLDLFTDYAALEKEQEKQQKALEKEKAMQQAALAIKKRYGKNAIMKGMNLQEGATARTRNQTIGGHKA